MKYIMKKKQKVGFLIFVMIILVFLQLSCRNYFEFSKEKVQMGVIADTLAEINGYDVNGTNFTEKGTEPYIVFESNLEFMNSFTITFNKKLEENKTVRIYYNLGDGFEEKNSITETFKKGNISCDVNIPEGKYKRIKLEIPGNFDMKDIIANGKNVKEDFVKYMICIFGCMYVDILFAIYILKVSKKSRKKRNKAEKITIKNIQLTIKLLNRQLNMYLKKIAGKCRINILSFFTVAGLVFGIFMSVIIPPVQVPDEYAHYKMMISEIGLDEQYYEEIQQFVSKVELDEVIGNNLIKADYSKIKKNINEHFKCREKKGIAFSLGIDAIKHFPMAVGLYMGIVLNLPIYFCLQMSELGAVLFFVIIGRIALKNMSVKKELLCAIMLLPMSLQQCSSVNYDAVLIPICYLLSSYILKFRYSEEKIMWKNMIFILFLTLAIFVIKMPYIVIILLLFVVPKEKFELKIGENIDIIDIIYKHKIITGIIFIVCACFGIFILRNNYYIKLILAAFENIKQYCLLLVNTSVKRGSFYVLSFVGNFGWLDTFTSYTFGYFVLVGLMIFAQTYDKKMENEKKYFNVRIISAIIFITAYVLIHTIMISWSFKIGNIAEDGTISTIARNMNKINIIEGVQGRYFLPITLCAFITFSGIVKFKNIIYYDIMYYIVVFAETINVLVERYWI